MTFLHRPRFAVGLSLVLLLVTPHLALKTHAQAPSATPPTTTTQNGQASPLPAYQLPPDKLAKAIAISRIRHIMDIVNGLWGLALLWLLLAFGISAGIENWAKSISQRRWVQGVIFFAAFILITWLAGLPLELFSLLFEQMLFENACLNIIIIIIIIIVIIN